MLKLKGYVDYDVNDVTVENAANVAFTESIKKADCITLDTTMNNFGTYLCSRLMSLVGMEKPENYSESVDEIGPGLDIDVTKVEAKVKELIAQYLPADLGLPQEMINGLLDMFVYCYCDFRVNFQENIRLIRELNPDAKLLVFGAYNGMAGLKCDIAGYNVDFGALWGAYMGLVNTFITTTSKYNDQYTYVDCAPGVRVFTGALAQDVAYPRYMYAMVSMTEGTTGGIPCITGIAQMYKSTVEGAINGAIAALGEAYKDVTLSMKTYEEILSALTDKKASAPVEIAAAKEAKAGYEAQKAQLEALCTPEQLAQNDDYAMLLYAIEQYGIAIAEGEAMLPLLDSALEALASYPRACKMAEATEGSEGEKLITERVFEAAKYAPLDFVGIFSAMGGEGDDIATILANAIVKEEPTGAELSVLHIYERFLSARGIGTHPDDVGCAQKADYVCQAFEKYYSAQYETQSAVTDLGKNVFNAAWGIFKAPIFDAIKDAFNKFASTIQNILNTIFQPVFSIFDKIPSC